MNTTRLLAGLGTLLLLAAPVAAQETSKDTEKARREAEAQMKKAEQQMKQAEQEMREAERAMQDAARKLGDLHMERDLRRVERKVVIFGDRARLGLVLQSEKNPKTDAIGAYVEGLTPGSPAEEAGLQPGDIIVKFNGEALASAKVEADEDESAPTAKLMELAQRPQGRRQGDAGVPARGRDQNGHSHRHPGHGTPDQAGHRARAPLDRDPRHRAAGPPGLRRGCPHDRPSLA